MALALLAMTALAALSGAAIAQTQRPVRVLVPSTPAGPSDTQARLFAPRKIAEPRLREFHKAVMHALTAPEVKERLAAIGMVVVGNTPEEFSQVVKADVEKYRKVIIESGIPRL